MPTPTSTPAKYEDRIVAFIDILGFSALVERMASKPEELALIMRVLKRIKFVGDMSIRAHTAQSDLEVSVFSDSIAISAIPSQAFSVIWSCGWLQADLLFSGVLTRGGIAIGPTIHQDGILLGEGLLTAYQIESAAAVYPRVILDSLILDRITSEQKTNFLAQDDDGLWFVDPFRFHSTPGNAEDLAAEGYDPREIYFEELGKHIASGLKRSAIVKHKSKWNWLSNRYQHAAKDHLSRRALDTDV